MNPALKQFPSSCPVRFRLQSAAGILLALTAVFGGAMASRGAEPAPPKNTVFRPTFISTQGPVRAGTAFVCEMPDGGSYLLLTVHHLFGPAGGMEKDVPGDRLHQVVSRVVAQSRHDSSIRVSSRKLVPIPDAKALDDTGLEHDVAAFQLEADKARPALKLARTQPKVGDRVWLFGQLPDREIVGLYPATVVFSSDKQLDYAFDQRSFQFPGTSGAPVLNATGEVVAINAGGQEQDGKSIGLGNPASSVAAHLKRSNVK